MELFEREITGVQYITYQQMIDDINVWSNRLSHVGLVAGIPRSGLTVAHILASRLNVPAVQLGCRPYRQGTGRALNDRPGTILAVDDCCSFGNAVNHAREISPHIQYGTVYARQEGVENCNLDYWYKVHAEPDWLVVTEWNWFAHQDSPYIAVTTEVQDGLIYHVEFGAVIDEEKTDEEIADQYAESNTHLLVMGGQSVQAEYVAHYSGKVVLHLPTQKVYGPAERIWVDVLH